MKSSDTDPERPRDDAPSEHRHRRAVLVAGVHRSGTSAATRLLNLAGLDLPRTMMPANDANVRGYFESRPIYEAHEALFREAGTTWDDLSPFPPSDWRSQPWAEEWIDRLAALVDSEFEDSPFFVLKDPRICRLLPIWSVVLERLGIEVVYLLTVRNPLEVASSLKRQYGIRHHRALLLWLDHLISAERASRGRRRYFLGYDELLRDWKSALENMNRDLDLELPPRTADVDAEIEAFLDGRLRHHEFDLAEFEEEGPIADWVRTAYLWARKASEGTEPSTKPLDTIATALASSSSVFGPLLAAEAADYSERSDATSKELFSQVAAREKLSNQLIRVQEAREQLVARLNERERELSRSTLWIRNLFSYAVKTRWGEPPPGDLMRQLLGILQAAKPGEVPELASAGLRWVDGEREVSELRTELEELQTRGVREASGQDETIQALQSECRRLGAELDSSVREGKAYATHLNDVGTRLALAEAEISGREARAAEMDTEIACQRVQIADREYAIDKLEKRLARIESSRFWRWSSPIRAVGRGLRALLDR